ncbi:Hsp20/alpha crystallin family protein [Pendulispora brunnea]|uniref:Hsp20/alpha crystallin family protein n=1 Tax=Pendulispora brunnea TaxID=2905690 RepID=A0ABZ2K6W8_9BACT
MLTYENLFRFDRALDDVMGATFGTATHRRSFSPSIDVFSDDERALFVVDVPGVKSEDLDITVDGRVLTIKGSRKFNGPAQSKNTQAVLGRSYGSFSRAFTLPDDLDATNLTAELSDGVLSIRIPKLEAAKPRRIQVSVATNGLPSAASAPRQGGEGK